MRRDVSFHIPAVGCERNTLLFLTRPLMPRSALRLSVCLSICLFCMSDRLSVCLSVCLSIFLSVCLSVYVSVCNDYRCALKQTTSTICLSVCPSIRLSSQPTVSQSKSLYQYHKVKMSLASVPDAFPYVLLHVTGTWSQK